MTGSVDDLARERMLNDFWYWDFDVPEEIIDMMVEYYRWVVLQGRPK